MRWYLHRRWTAGMVVGGDGDGRVGSGQLGRAAREWYGGIGSTESYLETDPGGSAQATTESDPPPQPPPQPLSPGPRNTHLEPSASTDCVVNLLLCRGLDGGLGDLTGLVGLDNRLDDTAEDRGQFTAPCRGEEGRKSGRMKREKRERLTRRRSVSCHARRIVRGEGIR